jgi:glutaconyl-CoA/methylmalonyl-CoA decarboxylase subunit gamma
VYDQPVRYTVEHKQGTTTWTLSPVDPKTWTVTLEERRYAVQVLDAGPPAFLLINQRPTLVEWRDGTAWVDGQPLACSVYSEQQQILKLTAQGRRRGPDDVKSPMPGRILRVLVQDGESVQAAQPLLIVEAMKMENQLLATAAGRVSAIHVQAGDTVDTGKLLITLVPLPAAVDDEDTV